MFALGLQSVIISPHELKVKARRRLHARKMQAFDAAAGISSFVAFGSVRCDDCGVRVRCLVVVVGVLECIVSVC